MAPDPKPLCDFCVSSVTRHLKAHEKWLDCDVDHGDEVGCDEDGDADDTDGAEVNDCDDDDA